MDSSSVSSGSCAWSEKLSDVESWELVAVVLVLSSLMSFAKLSFGVAMVLPSPVIVLIVMLADVSMLLAM
eukprot:14817719-Ditylum_brightwellii.AAC.1